MSAPKKGIEVDLKEMGCPYEATDTHATAWLEGYRKGHKDGADCVKGIYDDVLSRPGK